MLLQLQFRANGIIGLLSQSIASLLKLISMIIHWNHHENTLSWWVFTSQCSSREWNHPYKKACYPKYHPGPFSCSSVNNAERFLNNFERHCVPSWKQQVDFIFIHNSQEVEMQILVSMQTLSWEQSIEHVQIRGPISNHPFIQQIFILSPLHDFRQTVQPLCASVSLSVIWG